jgi:hypothetical protein
MAFEKAAYWMAVGVLALVVSNNFAARHESAVHCLASRSLTTIEQVSSNATGLMTTVETMLGRHDPRYVQAQTMVACAQTRMASVQTLVAQRRAALARVQAEHARMVTMQQVDRTVACLR